MKNDIQLFIVYICIVLNMVESVIHIYREDSAFESLAMMILWLIYAECLTLGGKQ